MIKYALGCAEGHSFDSWFPSSEAFDKQRKRGLVACPKCGDIRVEKAIMAPAVVGGERAGGGTDIEVSTDDRRRHVRETMLKLRREIEANTDDVGARFPEVARAIHEGDEPERAIRGQASLEEAKALIEEGVGVMPLPILADELN
jgi:hypothetical protein